MMLLLLYNQRLDKTNLCLAERRTARRFFAWTCRQSLLQRDGVYFALSTWQNSSDDFLHWFSNFQMPYYEKWGIYDGSTKILFVFSVYFKSPQHGRYNACEADPATGFWQHALIRRRPFSFIAERKTENGRQSSKLGIDLLEKSRACGKPCYG